MNATARAKAKKRDAIFGRVGAQNAPSGYPSPTCASRCHCVSYARSGWRGTARNVLRELDLARPAAWIVAQAEKYWLHLVVCRAATREDVELRAIIDFTKLVRKGAL